MLFNVSYKNVADIQQFFISASSISNVLIYCDSQGIVPSSIVERNQDLIINEPTQNYCFNVNLQGSNNETSTHTIFDNYNNTISWINLQTGKTLQSLNRINKTFVVA